MSEDRNSRKIKRRIRRAYAVSTVSIALVIFVLGAVGYFIINARAASDRLMENMTMSVMLKDKLSEEKIEALKKTISEFEGVKQIEFKSKAEAAKEFPAQGATHPWLQDAWLELMADRKSVV